MSLAKRPAPAADSAAPSMALWTSLRAMLNISRAALRRHHALTPASRDSVTEPGGIPLPSARVAATTMASEVDMTVLETHGVGVAWAASVPVLKDVSLV